MEKYKCLTHGVTLIVAEKQWDFQNPPGAYAGMPQCQLHLIKKPKATKIGKCEIVKEEG